MTRRTDGRGWCSRSARSRPWRRRPPDGCSAPAAGTTATVFSGISGSALPWRRSRSWRGGRVSARTRWRRAEAVLLTAAAVLLLPAGHLGASLTHGEGYFTEHAPVVRETASGLGRRRRRRTAGGAPADRVVVFADLVAPVLAAQLRVVPRAGESAGRPATGHGRRPIEGRRPWAGRHRRPRRERANWSGESTCRRRTKTRCRRRATGPVACRCRADPLVGGRRARDSTSPSRRRRSHPTSWPTLEALAGPLQRGGPTLPAVAVADAAPDALAAVRAEGFSVVADRRRAAVPARAQHERGLADHGRLAARAHGRRAAGVVAGPGRHARVGRGLPPSHACPI